MLMEFEDGETVSSMYLALSVLTRDILWIVE
jgi:hypothetical protein